jgi:putative glutamine amidotransferase
METRISVILITIISCVIISSCSTNNDNQKVRIAISSEKSDESDTKYADWLLRYDDKIEYHILYPLGIDSALVVLSICDGLLLTGGEDVYPDYYGKIDDTSRCGTFNRYRDSLEFALIEVAINNKIPVFGVCRGEQILNISNGGSLYIDIPSDFDTTVTHRLPGFGRVKHSVDLVEGSNLIEICNKLNTGEVVSNHHQGIAKLGNGLTISAYSEDGLPEAIEWNNNTGHPYLMAVQWHPETMDTLNPLSAPLAKSFLHAAYEYSNSN